MLYVILKVLFYWIVWTILKAVVPRHIKQLGGLLLTQSVEDMKHLCVHQ